MTLSKRFRQLSSVSREALHEEQDVPLREPVPILCAVYFMGMREFGLPFLYQNCGANAKIWTLVFMKMSSVTSVSSTSDSTVYPDFLAQRSDYWGDGNVHACQCQHRS